MTREERRDARRHLKKHGLERKEDSKKFHTKVGESIRRRYQAAQDRRAFKKSPQGRLQKAKELELEARTERAKTSIHKSKHARRSTSAIWGNNNTPRATGRRTTNRPRHQPPRRERMDEGHGDGLSSLFGGSTTTTTRTTKKSSNNFSGMDSLF